MLKNFCILFFVSLFAWVPVYCWEFEQNITLEGVLRRAERTIIKSRNGEKETKIERSIVLVTDSPLVLTHSVVLEKQQIASSNISYPHIEVYLPHEFMPLIGKRVQCSGTFRKTFAPHGDEIALDIDVALDYEQPGYLLKTLFYEPEEVEVSGSLYETVYPGPPEYMDVEMGDHPERVVILTLKDPSNVDVVGGKEADDFNEQETGVRELQVVFGDSEPSALQMKEEISLKGTLYHAHTAHHRRRVLMMVQSWK